MPVVATDALVRLQRQAADTRNICILAHVDHGKTSLTDSLIATNGIISPALAGQVRYLDARPDEQLRGITMESSAISLYFSMLRRSHGAPDDTPVKKEYLINLIDSPGHIDFASEVSTASRLCDGALVLVDAVEGVCSQTVTVLRHTWVERLRPLLVINKIDRLVTELRMTPLEAYRHMSRIVEQVNAVIGSFFQGDRMEEDLLWRERMEERVKAATEERERQQQQADETSPADDPTSPDTGSTADFVDRDDDDLYFSPEKNNVIFCSALDGWAFTVRQFAVLYEKKLGFKRALLEKVLWGDYFLDPRTKRVLAQKHLRGRTTKLKPMFVSLVLDNIWAVYRATTASESGKLDLPLLDKITAALGVALPPHVLRARDPRLVLTRLFAAWLPLSVAVLVSVVEYLPSPPAAQAARLPDMIRRSPGAAAVSPEVSGAMVRFDAGSDAPVVAYVSKVVSIPESELPSKTKRGAAESGPTAEDIREATRRKREEIARIQAEAAANDSGDAFARTVGAFEKLSVTNTPSDEPVKDDPEHLIGYARLYSGTLSVGDEVYVLPPKWSPEHPHGSNGSGDAEPRKVTVTALYLLMGRALEHLDSVPAGMVFGIAGLEGQILKTGTLCSRVEGAVNLAGVTLASPPIVRVALEPAHPADLARMVAGCRLLERSDPCAQYEVLPSGEHVIITAGELHLERCLKDLQERFARCEIQAGEPIVPYRETIVRAADMAASKRPELPRGTAVMTSASGQLTLRVRVRPLPQAVTEFLTKHAATLKSLGHRQQHRRETDAGGKSAQEPADKDQDMPGSESESGAAILSLADFRQQLGRIFAEVEDDQDEWAGCVDKIIEFGPRRHGPNVLIDATGGGGGGGFRRSARVLQQDTDAESPESAPSASPDTHALHLFSDKVSYAFQLATMQGPLCNEPVQGIAVFIEEVSLAASDGATDDLGRLTGEVIRLVREGINQGFLQWSPRILLAMYSCEIQASAEVLGRVYGVITRRRGRILTETMKEGTPFFTILALLPVAESFGFSDEMRKRTSGAASPQLVFSGFEMLDEDPFWVPATEEELEDLGELADRENVAKRYVDAVRERKGLFVQGKKLVKDAEKQKTLKR